MARPQRRFLPERALVGKMAECAIVAKERGQEYWDGDPQYGFGGYHYDGHWRSIADRFVNHYKLKASHKVLEIGCGKGYLLYELTQAVPGLHVVGVDISNYAIAHAKAEVRSALRIANCIDLPFEDGEFDLVIAIKTLRDLRIYELHLAILEIQRVGSCHRFICDESYRSEAEKVRALLHQLTWETLYTPSEWEWFLKKSGFSGDTDFIYFE